MKTEKLDIFDIKKFSVDRLLIEKPEKLSCLESIEIEPNNFSMSINEITVHDARSHKLVYGTEFVVIKFYNSESKQIATLSAFGSCSGEKSDESFYVGLGSVVSETSFRVMKDVITNN
jgi:hypothetical protein